MIKARNLQKHSLLFRYSPSTTIECPLGSSVREERTAGEHTERAHQRRARARRCAQADAAHGKMGAVR